MIEQTPLGPQYVIPGAERVGEPERVRPATLKPLKPQKPCDVGLFSDDAKQVDLMDLL